ncbi:MAG: hypothetical protein COB39_04865 [Marinosulfonomonas sp.]|nr:MAG: hypothetical protein COB39_04865 [Marinosulfonomonas sp.]
MVVTNIPTADSIQFLALKCYFSAWQQLMDIISDFTMAFDDPIYEWDEEWIEYLEFCQNDFEGIVYLISQANELALKSKLCSVSPYLLLLNADAKFSAKTDDVDFSELRTADAIDLPNLVNSFCACGNPPEN